MLLSSLTKCLPSNLDGGFVECDIRSRYNDVLENLLCTQSINKAKLMPFYDILSKIVDIAKAGKLHAASPQERKLFTLASLIKACLTIQENSNALQEALQVLDIALLLGEPFEDCRILDAVSLVLVAQTSHAEDNSDNDDVFNTFLNGCSAVEDNLPSLDSPSLETFLIRYFQPEKPVKLTNCINHWPALKKWKHPGYWKRRAAMRTVPIEVGDYSKSGCVRFATMSEYIDDLCGRKSAAECGYMAQHRLLDFVPELTLDISIPDYCALSACDEPTINLWLGPAGTVTPLHNDPDPNFLAQVVGKKKLVLFSPDDSPYLYPKTDRLQNTSQVDIQQPDLVEFPQFSNATPLNVTLLPGEMLFMPKGWWHYVESIDISCSVNFFF